MKIVLKKPNTIDKKKIIIGIIFPPIGLLMLYSYIIKKLSVKDS